MIIGHHNNSEEQVTLLFLQVIKQKNFWFLNLDLEEKQQETQHYVQEVFPVLKREWTQIRQVFKAKASRDQTRVYRAELV